MTARVTLGKAVAVAFFGALLLLLALGHVRSEPKLIGRVSDYASVLSPTQLEALATKLKGIEETKDRPQVFVLTVKSLDGKDIESFTNQTFKAWGVGQKDKNNGILIVVSTGDRKIRIEVGYGLEGSLPDSRAKAIISEQMAPKLARGKEDYNAALNAAVDKITSYIVAKEGPAVESTPIGWPKDGPSWVVFILVIIVIIVVLLFLIGLFLASGGSYGDSSSSGSDSGGGGSSGGGGASGGY